MVKDSLRKMYEYKRKNRLKERSNVGSLLESKYEVEFVEGPDFIKARSKKQDNDRALQQTC